MSTRDARVYDRIAPVYDLMEAPMEWFGGRDRRARVIGGAHGDVLEVGVGTGRNLDLYPDDARVTGIDISEGMLERARGRASGLERSPDLRVADAESLPFEDDRFDTVTATCVFCSVDDPVRGLEEIRRVVRPDGEVRLLEHVRPRNSFLGKLFDWLTPLTRRLMGPEINRRTEANVEAAGLDIVAVRREGIWREIVARPSGSNRGTSHPCVRSLSSASTIRRVPALASLRSTISRQNAQPSTMNRAIQNSHHAQCIPI